MLNDPIISVTCDVCGDKLENLDLTPLAGEGRVYIQHSYVASPFYVRGWDARNIEGDIARYKWITAGDRHICDDCASSANEEEK